MWRALFIPFVALSLLAPRALPTRAAGHYLRGPNALGVRVGGQGSGAEWTPGGFKLNTFWDRHLAGRNWLNLQLNVVAGARGGACEWRCDRNHCWWDCHGWGGTALEFAIGVKWKFRPAPIRLVLYPKVGFSTQFISYPDDWYGVGVAFRGGGGIAYYFTRWFGMSFESNLNLGFSWVDNDRWPDQGGLALLWSIDFLFGVEFLF